MNSLGLLIGNARFVARVATACALISTQAIAQTSPTSGAPRSAPWGIIDAVGYGGLGFSAGLVANWSTSYEAASWGMATGSAAGMLAGWWIGHRARVHIANGQPISSAHRFGVSAGAVLAGATLGALVSVPMINGDGEGTPLGSDENAFAITTIAGGVAGILYAAHHQRELTANRVAVAPYRAPDGKGGVQLRVRF